MFLDDMVVEFTRHFDTPDIFLKGIAYWVAGTALTNKVHVLSPDEITTNLYTILVSPPGWYHKSSSLRTGLRILRTVATKGSFLPSNASMEAFGKLASLQCNTTGQGHGIMVYDEFRAFLGHVRKEYAASIATLVTEKLERGTTVTFARKSKDGVDVDEIPEGFVLSFVASTTTPWLLESMKGSDITGGMLSRFLLIEADKKSRSYELPTPIDFNSLNLLAKDLQTVVANYNGDEFKFRKDAVFLYRRLYREVEDKALSHSNMEFPSLISRIPLYMKKLALVHAAIASRGDLQIHKEDVEEAWLTSKASLDSCEKLCDEVIVGDSIYGKNFLRIRKMIANRHKINKSEVLKNSHLRVRELNEILDSLKEQGLVSMSKVSGTTELEWKG